MEMNLSREEALRRVRERLESRVSEIESKHGPSAAFLFKTIVADAFDRQAVANAAGHSIPNSIRT